MSTPEPNAPKRIALRIAGVVLFMVGIWGGFYVCMGLLPPTHWAQLPSTGTAIIICLVGYALAGNLME